MTASINGDTAGPKKQTISSAWPEKFITSGTTTSPAIYTNEFPLDAGARVKLVTIVDKDGNPILRATLLGSHTAVDFDRVTGVSTDPRTTDFMAKSPASSRAEEEGIHSFLWLLKRPSTANATDNRTVVVFRLVSSEKDEDDGRLTLTYEQVF